ncbi:NAD(P)H-dependent oxidoreductase subunit E [Campylobacter fetus]|uniref:Hydrogenase expression protein n=1 Tax=Campylobacter fetus subsp. testudinum TaxID=1507806 RepID=A0AAX0HA16_CAMFE|nr:NAD(P)H-dependent oxidoreductase subunit E [Campylobacter fetus]AGZ81059.1 NADH:quinone oxidoreductase I, chain E [Campylobacter fetus subsp. testudinum 03-427]AJB44815.1 hydrogenase expression protein [Campylobacter fetus subsp. testudinum]ALV64153.1 NADH:quinone oxidoreductase I, chain E [Campylobacter fetus subsp. testudinum Sp3]AVK80438.1 NAD(P)H-dependent oxidoreductase subunit E [Campylobacter fetus subsp. testudinum]EAI4322795.1 NAD(P)H-dependent oxidoreductase subunit E [Campylobact
MKFEFTHEQLSALNELKKKVDDDRALVLPSLWMVQRAQGFIDSSDVLYLEKTLGIRSMFYAEAIGFYSMFNQKSKGKFELKFCKTITCKLRGSDELIKFTQDILGIKMGETSSDGLFSLGETECLGYCEKAPCMLCNLEQIDSLDENAITNLIEKIRKENASS